MFKTYSFALVTLLFTSSLMAQRYETQQYEVVKTLEKAEIRFYPPVMKIKAPKSSGFNALFGYISGNNTDNTKIAMTTPVYMSNDAQGNEMMAFVLPKSMKKEQTPAPLSDSVTVYESESGYFIAYPFGGYALDWWVEKASNALKEIAASHNIQLKSDPLVLVYNSPYKLINRKNEVLFQIDEETLTALNVK